MISVAVRADEQGHAMGNNQSLQVGAEALSGLLGGVLAAVVVKLPLTHDFLNADRGRLKWDSPADVTGRRRSGTPGGDARMDLVSGDHHLPLRCRFRGTLGATP